MKYILTAALLFCSTLLNAQSPKTIRRIYVETVHFPTNPDLDAFVTSKLISALAKDCADRCIVLEANGDNEEDRADGVLTGAMLIQSGSDRIRVQGAMRLVAKDGSIAWADTIYSSPFARSASSSFAENTAKRLTAYLAQPRQ